MIRSIHISNYALIDNVDIDLTEGLNIITGETGAGKSIILGALSLLLGSRGDNKVITDVSRKAVVEATIEVNHSENMSRFFQDNSLDWNDDDAVILRRELSPNGRSRAFINDTPVSLKQLEEFSRMVIDIHSQHQNLLLSDPSFQLQIIDALSEEPELLTKYRKSYCDYKRSLELYNAERKRFESVRIKKPQLSADIERIDALDLSIGEQEELEKEKEQLDNFNYIKEALSVLTGTLSESDNSVVDCLRECVNESEDIKTMISDGESLNERLNSVYIELQDIAETYLSINSDLSSDSKRREYIDNRLDKIYRLQKRFNAASIDELLELRDKMESELDSLDSSVERLEMLQSEAKKKRAIVLEDAKKLSASRRKVADTFINILSQKAVPLGMKNMKAIAECSYTKELTEEGIDIIELKFAFNKNQNPLPVRNTASGGEISRLMLCIKSVLARKMQYPTIIFDEVDTGVSGEIADKMGEMMLDISRDIQVVAITHLPQVAAKGNTHFKVYKKDDDNKTTTHLIRLTDEERINELAVMLSGAQVSDEALANAKVLLN